MGIKTGIGVGAAQVFDTSGLVNNFAKMLQKKQQDEAKFQSEIADLISKVDTKGVRDQDKAEIAKMYSATKDLYAQAAATKNFQDKALLKAKISKAVGDINEYAARSADFSKKFVDLNNRIAQDYYDYDVKVLDKLREVGSKSLIDMGADSELNPMNYLKTPNLKSRESVFGSIFKKGENFAKVTKKDLPGGLEQIIKIAPDSYIVDNIKTGLKNDVEYAKLAFNNLRNSGVDIKSMTPAQISDAVVAQELAEYKRTYGDKYVSEPRMKPVGEKKSDSEKNTDQWEGLNAQVFGKNRAQAIENINRIAGSKATLKENANGSISVVYKPIVNAISGAGGFFPMESIEPRTVVASNGAELIAALRDAGVTGAGTSSFMRLGGAKLPKSSTPNDKGESLAEQMKKAKGGKK